MMRYILLFLLGVLAYASIGTLRKLAVGWPSEMIAFFRLAGAAMILEIIYSRGAGFRILRGWKNWAELILLGLVLAAAFTLVLEAFENSKVSSIKPLAFISPVVVILLSYKFLGEKITWMTILSALLAFAGLFVLWEPHGDMTAPYGVMLGACAFILFAISTVIVRKAEKDMRISDVLIYPFVFGACALFLWMLIFPPDISGVDWHAWPYVLGLVIATTVAYWSYDESILKLGAHKATLGYNIGKSLAGSLIALFVLGEAFAQGWEVAIVLFIASGIVLYIDSKMQKREKRRHIHH
jgi:drug/metabolite transporter (DMT)-like permease